MLNPEGVASVDETFPQLIESASDRNTYRIKGMADIDYVEVGIANAHGTQLLLVDEDAVEGVLSRLSIKGNFYRDIDNQDEWVKQYSQIASALYGELIGRDYVDSNGWTMGLIRWLDSRLGEPLLDKSTGAGSKKCKMCNREIKDEHEYCSIDCAITDTDSGVFASASLDSVDKIDNLSYECCCRLQESSDPATCPAPGLLEMLQSDLIGKQKLMDNGEAIGACNLLDGISELFRDAIDATMICNHCGDSLGSNQQTFKGEQVCALCFSEIAFNDDGEEIELQDETISTRTGGKTRYYNIQPKEDGYVDVDRICEQLKLTFAEGNTIKALFGIAIERLTGEARHTAAGHHIDAEKFKHYSKQVYLKASETDVCESK